jgi:DNA-3-methyladenine glycosylase II
MGFLGAAEPAFARIIDAYGGADPFGWHDGGRTGDSLFAALVLHVIGQQISAFVAFGLYDRLADLVGGRPTPENLLAAGPRRLSGCGISGAKVGYLTALAEREKSGELGLGSLDRLADDAAIAQLTRTPGIGVWTAQTFLIHQLHRPDVLPAAETGIRRAIAAGWSLERPPTGARVRAMGEAWRPFRSFAAALLWRSLYPPGEPSDPKERALRKLTADMGSKEESR